VTSLAFRERVEEMERQYPKAELIRLCEEAGHMGGIHPLSSWSRFELATEAAKAEQRTAA
jgi:hypothetical protein